MLQLLAQLTQPLRYHDQHTLAYQLLEHQMSPFDDIPKPLRIRKDKYGKPVLQSPSRIFFNLSHCNTAVLSGIGDAELGVDVETLRPMRERVLQKICTASEQEEILRSAHPALQFLRFWTLKESYVKALGIGISYPMQSAVFSLRENRIQTNLSDYTFFQYVWDGMYVISACIRKQETECQLKFTNAEVTPEFYHM